MASSRRGGKKSKKKKKAKKKIVSLRPAVTSVFFISSSWSRRKQNPNPCSILQCHLFKSLVPCPYKEGGGGWGEGQKEAPSSLRSSQAGEESLSWKQKAKQGHRKAHPGRQVLSPTPHELQRKKAHEVVSIRDLSDKDNNPNMVLS